MSRTREIPLTQGKVAVVDLRDYDEQNSHKWHAKKSHRTFYAVRNAIKNGKRIKLYMHREILKAIGKQKVDHRHHNGLDNRRCELRFCNTSQSNMNRRPVRNCVSRYKGVFWDKVTQKWRAEIKRDGKRTRLGYFSDETNAAKAYDKAAKKLFKDFAVLNFECETGRSLDAGGAAYGAAHPQL